MTEAEWLECTDPRLMLEHVGSWVEAGKSWLRSWWSNETRFRTSERQYRLFACACCRPAWHDFPAPARQAIEVNELFADGKATAKQLRTARLAAAAWATNLPPDGDLELTLFDIEEAIWDVPLAPDVEWMSQVTHPIRLAPVLAAAHAPAWSAVLLIRVARCLGDPEIRPVIPAMRSEDVEEEEEELQSTTYNPDGSVRFRYPVLRYSSVWTAEEGPAYRFSRRGRLYQAHLLRDIFNPFHPVGVADEWLAWNGGIVPSLAQRIYEEQTFGHLPILADALEEAGCTNDHVLSHCRLPGPHVRGCWVVDLTRQRLTPKPTTRTAALDRLRRTLEQYWS